MMWQVTYTGVRNTVRVNPSNPSTPLHTSPATVTREIDMLCILSPKAWAVVVVDDVGPDCCGLGTVAFFCKELSAVDGACWSLVTGSWRGVALRRRFRELFGGRAVRGLEGRSAVEGPVPCTASSSAGEDSRLTCPAAM